MNHGSHLKHMLIAGGAVLAGLLIFGVPTGSALLYAAALACPLGMVAMMYVMGRDHQGAAARPTTPRTTLTPATPIRSRT